MKRRTVSILVLLCCGAMLHGQTGRERKNCLGIRTSFGTSKAGGFTSIARGNARETMPAFSQASKGRNPI